MDFNKIKNLISGIGGRCIIIEDNEPKYVLLGFDEFSNMVGSLKNIDNVFEGEAGLPKKNTVDTVNTANIANTVNTAENDIDDIDKKNKEIIVDEESGIVKNSDIIDDVSADLFGVKEESAGEIRIEDLPF